MKSFWLLLFLLIPTPIKASQDILPELVRRIKPSAVAVETFDSRGEKLSRGSGFFVDVDRIVTNRHVLENAHRAEVHSTNGAIFQVKGVLAVDAEGDLALLKIDVPPTAQIRPLPLDKTSPQEGESIVVIGNPLGLEGSVTNGIVSAVRDIPTFGRIIQITAPISSGSSGSPVVNTAGEFVGIIFDGNLASLVLDFAYEDKVARAISVDSRGILEAMRKVYGVDRVVDELLSGRMK